MGMELFVNASVYGCSWRSHLHVISSLSVCLDTLLRCLPPVRLHGGIFYGDRSSVLKLAVIPTSMLECSKTDDSDQQKLTRIKCSQKSTVRLLLGQSSRCDRLDAVGRECLHLVHLPLPLQLLHGSLRVHHTCTSV